MQERKLYGAIVALEEGADLADRLVSSGTVEAEDDLRREAEQLRNGAAVIRKIIEERGMPAAD